MVMSSRGRSGLLNKISKVVSVGVLSVGLGGCYPGAWDGIAEGFEKGIPTPQDDPAAMGLLFSVAGASSNEPLANAYSAAGNSMSNYSNARATGVDAARLNNNSSPNSEGVRMISQNLTGRFTKIDTNFGTTRNNQGGISFDISAEINNAGDKDFSVAIYFADENLKQITGVPGYISDDGYLAVGSGFMKATDSRVCFDGFIPYSAFPSTGGQSRLNYYTVAVHQAFENREVGRIFIGPIKMWIRTP
jgi:hypothetical protein